MFLITQSAYFVISEDAKHGENLVCSYYACRNGGIKFRYCAYCMAPVAKRNFSRRHDHGMSKKKGANSIRDDEEEEDDDDGESEYTGSEKGSMNNSANSSQPSSSLKRPKEAFSEDDGNKRLRMEADPITSAEAKISDDPEGQVSSKRRSMWNDLLSIRPCTKDPKDLSSWLNEVLAVSDLEFPLEQVGAETDDPFGNLLLNEVSKLSKPAATPTEDEACDSSNAPDTIDTSLDNSNSSQEFPDSATKDNSSSGNNKNTNTNTADNVIGNEKSSTTSSENPKEADTEIAAETGKDKTKEAPKPVDDAASSNDPEIKDPKTSVVNNSKTDDSNNSNNSKNKSSSKGVKLLGKKAKHSLKKGISAGDEEKEKQRRKEEEEDEDGFAGSFADWRDRKKGKSLKKGSSSLRK